MNTFIEKAALYTCVVGLGLFLSHPANAIEIWNCTFPSPPAGFPASIQFFVESEDQLLERGHLPYQILVNNGVAIIAVSAIAAPGVGHPIGSTGHSIEQEFLGGKTRWNDVLISAETLEIDLRTGSSVLATIRPDKSSIVAVHGVCKKP